MPFPAEAPAGKRIADVFESDRAVDGVITMGLIGKNAGLEEVCEKIVKIDKK